MSGAGTATRRARAAAALRAAIPRPRSTLTWTALALVAVGALATVAVLIWAATYDAPLPTSAAEVGLAVITVAAVVAFALWALAPFAAMAAVALAAERRDGVRRVVRAVVAAGALAVTALGGWALADFVASDSSTAALIFSFLPFYQLVVVAACAAVALGVHTLVRWHHRRRLPPGALGRPPVGVGRGGG